MDAVASGLPYAVVLMDVQMPRLDGYHATARLRGMGYDGVIVALTAHAMGAERQRCLDAGCNDFLSKPVEPAELVDTITKFVVAPPATGSARRSAAGAAGAEPAEPPLVSHLAESDGLEDLLREFVEGLAERVAAMERDFLASDMKSLAARSHQLKGTAGAYGFPVLTEAARELETALKAGRSGRELRAKLDRIASLCRRATHLPARTDAERRPAAMS
jgi:CheY-like chemotaxis protein